MIRTSHEHCALRRLNKLQNWLRILITVAVVVVAFAVLVAFLSIAIRIAFVLALLAIAYYFFHRALQMRRDRQNWR